MSKFTELAFLATAFIALAALAIWLLSRAFENAKRTARKQIDEDTTHALEHRARRWNAEDEINEQHKDHNHR